MVVQKVINNLKDGPKEDKIAVASGIAIAVVVILLVAWAIFFFPNIQEGGQQVNLSNGAADFLQIPNDTVPSGPQTQPQTQVQQTQGTESDQLSSPNPVY